MVFPSVYVGPWLFSKLVKEGHDQKKQNGCVEYLICGTKSRIVGKDIGKEATPNNNPSGGDGVEVVTGSVRTLRD